MSSCPKCHRRVVADAIVVNNAMWHPHCFKCLNCQKKLGGKPFHQRKDVAFCTKCYNKMYRQRCVQCCDPIKRFAFKAMGIFWHPGCFRCTICRCILQRDYYLSQKNQQQCSTCHKEVKLIPKRMEFPMPKLYHEINSVLLEPDIMHSTTLGVGANTARNVTPPSSKFANLSNKFININFPLKRPPHRLSSPISNNNESTKVSESSTVNIVDLICPNPSSFNMIPNFKMDDIMAIPSPIIDPNKEPNHSNNHHLISEKR